MGHDLRRAAAAAALMALWAAGTAAAEQGRVKGIDVNLRAAPSTSSRILTTLPRGSAVEILASAGEWYKVRGGEPPLEGFVHSRFLDRVATPPPPAVEPAPTGPATGSATA